ncbi:MAG: undecaprenyldiphospho-muramoylpentapeptide beta-N-acetylglucosaminyltransferase [Candidatus Binataceae bacterium]
MRVIIAGGGTGGHLFPAVALGEEIVRERADAQVIYAGTTNGFEARWLPKSGYQYELFDVHGIRGHNLIARVRALGEFIRAIGLARALVKRFRPDLVVSAGGYASAPTVIASILARVPFVMMEQNTKPGLSNRMLWPFARKICVSFADSRAYFSPSKTVLTGNPVRYRPAGPESRPANGGQKQILVLGGSTGARRLNFGVLGAFKIWGKSVINWTLLHQCGEADVELLRAEYGNIPVQAEVVPFIEDVPQALARATLVVARGGGGTVTDIALAGRPAIFVPYPFHPDMQQLHNARVIEKIGGAIIVNDDDRLAENLAREVKAMMADPARLIEMGQHARQAVFPDAAARVARVCFDVAAVEN